MPLAGSEWGFKDEVGDDQRFVQFGADGVVSGSGGCNRFSGTYVQKGDELLISGLRVTMMFCGEDGVMDREQAFLEALDAARRLEASHLELKLMTADGTVVLDLARRDFD